VCTSTHWSLTNTTLTSSPRRLYPSRPMGPSHPAPPRAAHTCAHRLPRRLRPRRRTGRTPARESADGGRRQCIWSVCGFPTRDDLRGVRHAPRCAAPPPLPARVRHGHRDAPAKDTRAGMRRRTSAIRSEYAAGLLRTRDGTYFIYLRGCLYPYPTHTRRHTTSTRTTPSRQ
jgi:hypothetical protein